jgi:hypothetical protein
MLVWKLCTVPPVPPYIYLKYWKKKGIAIEMIAIEIVGGNNRKTGGTGGWVEQKENPCGWAVVTQRSADRYEF